MKEKLMLSPLLILYLVAICFLARGVEIDYRYDEPRYILMADQLVQGFSSSREPLNIWNGPGYPMVLTPFTLFRAPWLAARLMNGFFLFGAVLFFQATLTLFLSKKQAYYFSWLFGLFPPFFAHLHLLLSETLAVLLMCGFIYFFCRIHQSEKNKPSCFIGAGFFLAFLSLTKIIFGYALLVGLIFYGTLYILKRSRPFKRTLVIYGIALLVCLPYLFYTYALTGKVFYWADSGGLSLYWMSSPFPEELGDWLGEEHLERNPVLLKNHKHFFDSLSHLSSLQKDEIYKVRAIENMRADPKKYFYNWLANWGRLFFNYPYSYTPQKFSTLAHIIPNMFLLVFLIVTGYPAYRGRKKIPQEIYALMTLAVIVLAGSSLVSAYSRQLLPLIPVLSLWLFFILTRIVKIEIRS